MNFTEFNESVDTRLSDLSELTEKYNIFNESVQDQLNINIEKAKLYVEESKGTVDDLVFLINEAEDEANDKFSASLDKLQKSAVSTFNGMADDLARFADSAQLSVVMDKLKNNKELADKTVSVELSDGFKELDKAKSDTLAKLTVLKVNVNAVISVEEINKLDSEIKSAIEAADKNSKEISVKATEAVSIYQKKLAEVKQEVNADKTISNKMNGISSDKSNWKKRSSENKKQIMRLVQKLTNIMSKKVSILKSDITKLSASIKAPKSEPKKEEVKKEKVEVSDLLNSIIEEKVNDFVKESEVQVTEETDEADKILAEIEASITESENNKINEIEEVTFDESTNVDEVVDSLLQELI